ncbi:DUF5682 family protein [Actinoplanes sp. NBRC 101535]|uniref:DUF5682 family protein n=1 Tax=Actinoplanes sp. NBRC 101535 TaxID=3032196 RepID=UPI0024A55DED|nr:DUF5682 family protein [Actinoplanes sp. NBRC 101535]GLY06954.1 hypothetical protein Acsp01_73330 [Actinoplanes sp. NBRC 101535]
MTEPRDQADVPEPRDPLGATEPRDHVDRLAGDPRVHLIGVRHHSPVLAAAMPAILTAFRPETVLVELPAEMQPWVRWLAAEGTVTPVALAADGAFYPFADFSPELAAVRWAREHGVPVDCCDLPMVDPAWRSREPAVISAGPGLVPGGPGGVPRGPGLDAGRPGLDSGEPGLDSGEPGLDSGGPGLGEIVRASLTGRDGDELWDRWIEAGAPGSSPEAVRRAALAAGWALRHDAGRHGIDPLDLRREAWMRGRIAAATGRVAVVVGAFHAPALLDGDVLVDAVGGEAPVVSLVPYTFDLLDSRSGYPAGIRDPRWQQAVYENGADPERIRLATHTIAVEVTRELRNRGWPAGPGEAAEVARLAGDLAALRSLPAPSRGELVEALQSVLAQGAPAGVGRGVARAMENVLVGQRRGRVAAGTPIGGLTPAVEKELQRLKLPGPGKAAQRIRLDPLRSPTDRARELAIRRLEVCGAAYGDAGETGPAVGGETLTTTWRVQWTPPVDAALAVAGAHGVTLEQAAAGMLATRRRREHRAGGPTAEQALTGLARSAACGLGAAVQDRLSDVRRAVTHDGTVEHIVTALGLVRRIGRGHHPGLVEPVAGADGVLEEMRAAAVAAVSGLAGSQRVEDARALHDLVRDADEAGQVIRLGHAVRELATNGSPLMRGAAAALGVQLGQVEPGEFGQLLASWAGMDSGDRLRGALSVAGAMLQAGGEVLEPLLAAVERMADDDFVRRLPGLRDGFDVLSPADRDRLLATVRERHGGFEDRLVADPVVLAGWLAADRAGMAAVRALGLVPEGGVVSPLTAAGDVVAAGDLSAVQRWRLLLGREKEQLSGGQQRLATALDELYGTGRGEGSHTVDRGGGGTEAPYPRVRDWLTDLEALFGSDVRDEVIARAAERGRVDAILAADPERVRPSVDLLHAVLSLAGGLPEARLAKLRPLVARLTRDLTRQLARRIRPALTGIGTPRTTRRRTARLDLAATVRRNLHTVRAGDDGRPRIVPERPVFRSPGRRSVDWQVILLVDVSGSMEESTIWAAMTASVLAGVPSLRTHFVTFSTEVVDLTDRVDDPLALLLGISVGGGTHIAAGMRYARQITLVPARTLVVTISDFEEGFPIGDLLGSVRALVDDGVNLLGCASLDDRGAPRYSTGVASQLVGAGMPVAALSPLELARWIGEKVR